MSAVIPGQASDREVAVKPTHDEAQLFVSMLNGPMFAAAMRGMALLREFGQPPTSTQLLDRYARSSPEHQDVTCVLALGETIAGFVKLGLLPRALIDEMLWMAGAWRLVERVALDERAEMGQDAIYENFEGYVLGRF